MALLDRLDLANPEPEPSFDRLVRIAARAAGTPVALITFLGEDRQWIKAAIGFEAKWTSLSDAFCVHVQADDRVMEVPDASRDQRFVRNTLVNGPDHIRFYAGYPIVFEGLILGTVCVLDKEPGRLGPDMEDLLADLSAIVSEVLQVRHQQRILEEEQKRLMETRIAHEAAEQANKKKSEFLSRVSHELRTPLNAILGFAQVLLMDVTSPLDDVQRERVQILHTAAEQLLSLIDDLLEVSRLEQGGLAVAMRPLDLGAAVDRALRFVQLAAKAAGVEVRNAVLPGVMAFADERALGQVMLNLLSNAVKYNRSGGQVSVHATEVREWVVLSVQDSGQGMSEDQLARVFQPFDRLGAEKTGVPGSGLGLVIAKGLTEAMGGELSLSSATGVGTTAHVTLKRAAAPVSPAAQPAPAG